MKENIKILNLLFDNYHCARCNESQRKSKRSEVFDLDNITNYLMSLSVIFQMCDFIESEFLEEQVNAIKEISDHVTQLKRVGAGLGEYQYDKQLQS